MNLKIRILVFFFRLDKHKAGFSFRFYVANSHSQIVHGSSFKKNKINNPSTLKKWFFKFQTKNSSVKKKS